VTVYLHFNDADWEAHQLTDEEEEAGAPEKFPNPDSPGDGWVGPIPRVGEFVLAGNSWWEVLVVAYSSFKRPPLAFGHDLCWVDVTVRLVDHDPREIK
jgi:hypothetical protein